MQSLVCVGDNTVDTYLDQARQFPGGNAVNVAVFSARQGANSAYVGCVGHDARGALILRSLEREGVEVARCRTLPGATAWACVTHLGGDRVFLGSSPGVCKSLVLSTDDLTYFQGFDRVHSSIYSGLEQELGRIRAHNPHLSFDFSDDWDAGTLKQLAPQVEIAFLSCAHLDLNACTALLYRVHALGPAVVVLTRGGDGALALANGEVVAQAITPTELVDTLGAGDGFISAFLLAWCGDNLSQALRAAADYAASVCSYVGGYGHGTDASAEEIEQIKRALNPA